MLIGTQNLGKTLINKMTYFSLKNFIQYIQARHSMVRATKTNSNPSENISLNCGAAQYDANEQIQSRYIAYKAIFDYTFALFSLLLLFPVFLLIALAIKISSPGPVFFIQKRWGKNGSIINVFKFRTMYSECSMQHKKCQTEIDDPRVTTIGAILRRTSLDELPQFLNVLRGEMSVVGPRPHALDMTIKGKANNEMNPKYFDRYKIKPGMTGLAQIKGYRGPVNNTEHLENRIRYDLEYIRKQSFFLDLLIVLQTMLIVIYDPNSR